MPSKALEDVIGIAPLTEALRATTSGIPNPFPAEFSTVKPQNRILGDRARMIVIKGARTTAKVKTYGSAARRVPLQPLDSKTVHMLNVGLEFLIDCNMLVRLQAFLAGGPYHQDSGVDFIKYQIAEVGKRMANTRIVAMATTLQLGAIYYDADFNILPTSSGAAETISFGVPANNQNQLNGIISAPWSVNNTDIFLQLRSLEQQAAKDTGMPPAHCMYGKNIVSYFQNNALLQGYFARNANFRDTLIDTRKIPKNFGDIATWTPVYNAFFEDVNGTNQALWNDDLVVFTPDMSTIDHMDWWAMYEGSAACLTGFNISTDAIGALANVEQKYGQSGWAMPSLQAPLGITVNLQDVFLSGIRNEKAIYQAVCAF
jgi:hypothetical protein